jgi:hypothetical protein
MCTQCFHTAEPETLLMGSDRIELAGWLCFAAPGWLYCLWRHSLRAKRCAACGGSALVRQSKAAQARQDAIVAAEFPARICSASGGLTWPRALETPRDRLRHGGLGILLWISLGLGSAVGWAGLAPALSAASAAWVGYEIARVFRLRDPACAAWDESGRQLPIHLM